MVPAAGELESGVNALGETVDVKEPDAENAMAKINAGLDSLTAASNAASAIVNNAEKAYPKYKSDVLDEEGNVLHKAGDMKAPSDLGPEDREGILASVKALAGLFLPPSADGASPARAALEAMAQTLTGLRELSKAVDPVQIPAPPEEIDTSFDAIQSALNTLRESLSSLNGRGLSSAGALTADVQDINAQFGVVSDTLMDLFYDLENPDVDDRINDTSAEAPELPAAVRTQIAAATPDEAMLRLVRAWLRLNAAEPLDADVTLRANCGPLVLDDQLEWSRYHKDGAAVAGVPDEPAATVLLRLAYRLCMFGEPAAEERGGAAVYSLTLDEAAMAQLFETALPESEMLDVELTLGKLLVTLSGNWIEGMSFSASGDVRALGVSAPAGLSMELRFAAN